MCHMAHKGFSTNLNYFQVPVVILVLGMLNVPVLFTEFSEIVSKFLSTFSCCTVMTTFNMKNCDWKVTSLSPFIYHDF